MEIECSPIVVISDVSFGCDSECRHENMTRHHNGYDGRQSVAETPRCQSIVPDARLTRSSCL